MSIYWETILSDIQSFNNYFNVKDEVDSRCVSIPI